MVDRPDLDAIRRFVADDDAVLTVDRVRQHRMEAIQRMREHQRASLTTVRRGWTTRQWCEDADRLMNDLDGSITSLVNGHVSALLRERRALLAVAEAADRSIAGPETWEADELAEALDRLREVTA
jgi:hypothetical protein